MSELLRKAKDLRRLADSLAAGDVLPSSKVARVLPKVARKPRGELRSASEGLQRAFPPRARTRVPAIPIPVTGLLIVLGLGLVAAKSRVATAKPMLPGAPDVPDPGSPGGVPEPGDLPSPEPPLEHWNQDRTTLNALQGYHRATVSEVGPTARLLSPGFLSRDLGTVHLFEADGKNYAAALEIHHGPTSGKPEPHDHKGVSIFVEDS